MELAKKDFIEIEFSGKLKNGEIFDSNIKDELEKLHTGHNHPIDAKPFIFCLGEGMFISGVDKFLIGKKIGEYTINLKPEDAFGKRNQKLIQIIPSSVFTNHKIVPIPGQTFNFDGKIAKIISVSGGRVIADFNNLLSGREVFYFVKVLRKVEDLNEKIKALNEFLFKQNFSFEIKEKKLILKVPKEFKEFVLIFREKYKDFFGLDLEINETENKTKEEN